MTIGKDEIEATLERSRKTVAAAKALLAQVDLRIQETDRFLAQQGLTRAEVQAMRFTPEQKKLVNEELVRRGLAPLPEEEEPMTTGAVSIQEFAADEITLEARQRKFGTFMRQFRI